MKVSRARARLPKSNSAPGTRPSWWKSTWSTTPTFCERGLVWGAQIYQCEPFSGDLRPTQCYKCWGHGHMAKWCHESARCGRCAASAHEGGEEKCPSNTGEVPVRCRACGGNHRVWNQNGQEANRRWDAAREAYAHRPARFEIEGQGRNVPNRPPAAMTGDGFQVVAGKKRTRIVSGTQDEARKAGRPRAIAKAGQAFRRALRSHHHFAEAPGWDDLRGQGWLVSRCCSAGRCCGCHCSPRRLSFVMGSSLSAPSYEWLSAALAT
jgi:hypothetical protein